MKKRAEPVFVLPLFQADTHGDLARDSWNLGIFDARRGADFSKRENSSPKKIKKMRGKRTSVRILEPKKNEKSVNLKYNSKKL